MTEKNTRYVWCCVLSYLLNEKIIRAWLTGEGTEGFHMTAFSCPLLDERVAHYDRRERATWYSHLTQKKLTTYRKQKFCI